MKAGKKPLGIKHRSRQERKREKRRALAVTVAILIIIIFVFGFVINSMFNPPSSLVVSSTSEPKAAIVDHLSLTHPNQTFIETATNTLKQAGYTVDYYPGEEVTVEFYKNLPAHGYGLIIFRVHSAVSEGTTRLALFTSEPYSKTKYVYEQLSDQVTLVGFQPEGPYYFGINSFFVTQTMKGQFRDTTIIMTGCDGLKYSTTAEAFIQKGAKAYIGWSDAVLASHTDQAITQLLQHLVIERQTIDEAVLNTMRENGQDPKYKSQLLYYPLEAGSCTIQNIVGPSS